MIPSKQPSAAPVKLLVLAILSCFSGTSVFAASEVNVNAAGFQPAASPITIVQEGASNTVGIVENAAQLDSAVKQTGTFNRVAIIQLGNDKAVLLRQPGVFNRALVVQVANTAQDRQNIDARQGEGVNAVNYIYSLQTSANSTKPIEAEFGRLTLEQAKVVANNFVLAPEVSRVNVGMLEDISLNFNSVLENQIDQQRFQPCSEPTSTAQNSDAGGSEPLPLACAGKPFFATMGYSQANKASAPGFSGYDHSIRSATLGSYFWLNPQTKLGLAFQYTDSHSTVKDGLGSVHAKGYQIGAFGSFSDAGYYLDAIGNVGRVDFSADRFGGASRVYSDSKGWHYTGRAQGGYFFENGGLRFGPFASASYSKGTADGYQENGSTLLTQVIDKQTRERISASLGGAFHFNDTLAGYPVSSYLKAEVVRDLGRGSNDVLQSRFSFSPQMVMTPLNDNTADTYGRVSAGVNVALRKDVKLTFSGTTLLHTDRLKRHNAYLGLSVDF
ncbi:MAG: autotransporter outer membrane beta-barrel domain-containing protein [Burkholderiaceae bacterium]|nr:autotransporter outer membrane beta-barrel domain-containing protein [Burkholderiaceae bacterium]